MKTVMLMENWKFNDKNLYPQPLFGHMMAGHCASLCGQAKSCVNNMHLIRRYTS